MTTALLAKGFGMMVLRGAIGFAGRLMAIAAMFFSGCGPSDKTSPPPANGASADGSAGSGSAATTADYSHLSGTVKVNGSSSVFPVSEAAAEDFQEAAKSMVKVTVGEEGTGSGFKKFLRGEIDICDASRPITSEEIAGAKEAGIEFIELPVCFDALTIAVHPSNKLDSISTADLKKMWEPEAQGVIKRWNQINPEWPDEDLVLFGAGSSSGTFEYFTGAVTGKAKSSRGDYTASEDDNVLVQGIAGNKQALGYIPYAYYEPNKAKLKALAVDWDNDDLGPISPTLENVELGKYNPFSRPLFLYVNRKSAERAEVKAFVEYYLKNARTFAEECKYLPLPETTYPLVERRFSLLEVGTAFDGKPEFGLRVEDILKRPLKK